ncbi:MFS family permease [Massilia violacea]|uniref:MFS family permease n=1 Tax=Pseudoduganella violacea TaxID=1715466 RepID=A0A7W5B9J9_9BURK|nr:MFS family permease [Pseudoduganella violacea]
MARILTGLAHGVFFSVGAIIATTLVPKEKTASTIATMFSGMTVAFVAGIPLGTFIGQHFGWRAGATAASTQRADATTPAAGVRDRRPLDETLAKIGAEVLPVFHI